jgi:hypothetical protein
MIGFKVGLQLMVFLCLFSCGTALWGEYLTFNNKYIKISCIQRTDSASEATSFVLSGPPPDSTFSPQVNMTSCFGGQKTYLAWDKTLGDLSLSLDAVSPAARWAWTGSTAGVTATNKEDYSCAVGMMSRGTVPETYFLKFKGMYIKVECVSLEANKSDATEFTFSDGVISPKMNAKSCLGGQKVYLAWNDTVKRLVLTLDPSMQWVPAFTGSGQFATPRGAGNCMLGVVS